MLVTESGSEDCYPFADAVGELEGYPESEFSQCLRPESTSSSVCAIEYTTAAESAESCPDRRYALVATYPSQEEAESAGAVVTHGGGVYWSYEC